MRKKGNCHLLLELILIENICIFFDPMWLEKMAVVAFAGILLCLFPHEKLDKKRREPKCFLLEQKPLQQS